MAAVRSLIPSSIPSSQAVLPSAAQARTSSLDGSRKSIYCYRCRSGVEPKALSETDDFAPELLAGSRKKNRRDYQPP